MKKTILILLLLPAACIFAQKTKPNAADYPLTIRIVGSQGSDMATYQHVEAVIDGKQVELQGAGHGVLALGDYPAQKKPGVNAPKKDNGHDVFQAYELLFSDGTTRYYEVVGFGTPEPACSTLSKNP